MEFVQARNSELDELKSTLKTRENELHAYDQAYTELKVAYNALLAEYHNAREELDVHGLVMQEYKNLHPEVIIAPNGI